MKNVLIIGLGIQGKKRKKILDEIKVKSISLDPKVLSSDYKSLKLTEEQKQQAYRLLTEYDEKVIKFAFNRLMFG